MSTRVDTNEKRRAFELKFVVELALAMEIQSWARERLVLDAHGDPRDDDRYLITSLYLDTAESDVLHRSQGFRRRRYRVRRYGDEQCLWLERHTKRANEVRLRRSSVHTEDAARLASPMTAGSVDEWNGSWFNGKIQRKTLLPAAITSYRRAAFDGAAGDSSFSRLTLDYEVLASRANGWDLAVESPTRPLFERHAVLELKFAHAMPLLFKELVAQHQLDAMAVSKYRAARAALATLPSG